jgi:hypothetical protein
MIKIPEDQNIFHYFNHQRCLLVKIYISSSLKKTLKWYKIYGILQDSYSSLWPSGVPISMFIVVRQSKSHIYSWLIMCSSHFEVLLYCSQTNKKNACFILGSSASTSPFLPILPLSWYLNALMRSGCPDHLDSYVSGCVSFRKIHPNQRHWRVRVRARTRSSLLTSSLGARHEFGNLTFINFWCQAKCGWK